MCSLWPLGFFAPASFLPFFSFFFAIFILHDWVVPGCATRLFLGTFLARTACPKSPCGGKLLALLQLFLYHLRVLLQSVMRVRAAPGEERPVKRMRQRRLPAAQRLHIRQFLRLLQAFLCHVSILLECVMPVWATLAKSTPWAQQSGGFSHSRGGKQSAYGRAGLAGRGRIPPRGKISPRSGVISLEDVPSLWRVRPITSALAHAAESGVWQHSGRQQDFHFLHFCYSSPLSNYSR
jgi:hypothetical protein